MPSALVQALITPLVELQTLVGSGDVPGGTAAMLRRTGNALDEVAASGAGAAARMGDFWSGTAADAAARFDSAAVSTTSDAASRSLTLASRVDAACEAVRRARAELQRIVDDFTATAFRLEQGRPHSTSALVAAARRACDEAIAVVKELQAELDDHAAAVRRAGDSEGAARPVTAPSPPPAFTAPAFTAPAGGAAAPAMSSAGGAPPSPLSLSDSPAGGQWPEHASLASRIAPDPEAFGSGVAIRLPDGSTAIAPNVVAADAVHNALTQLGVPYSWGGTTPGAGLDCSGLTQWAYREAGLELPRLAQEQDVGAPVSANALMPGDLAVWDGHVAMIVGDGMMIEAGDPVQLSPIRTTNLGQGFQGFWRPTA